MGTTLNKETYEKLIAADLNTLSELPHSLEKDHIISVLNDSVDFYYQPRESQKAETGESNCTIFSVTNRLFEGADLATVKAEYMIGYDTYNDDQYTYILARKVGGVTEILLNKTCRIRNKDDKNQFEADVNKLAEHFNCEVRGINGW